MLKPTQVLAASTAVRELRVALSNFFLYSNENSMVQKSLDRFLISLSLLFENLESVTLGESEGRLVMEGSALDERLTGSTNMIKDLFTSHKLHSLTFLKDVQADELKALFSLLRPKALPTGLSLSQAIIQQSLEHVRANEKVFVALSEGEVVVSGESVPGTGKEQNLQEALEALQYFLQIFARVKPDSNKQEVARHLMDHMGGWLVSQGAEVEAGVKRGPDPGVQQAWTQALGGFLSLKNNLAAVKKPTELKNAKDSMDDLLKRLVSLAEGQGVKVEESADVTPVPPVLTSPHEPVPSFQGKAAGTEAGQGELFTSDTILEGIAEGNLEPFFDPGMEEKVDQKMSLLQDLERTDDFETLWCGLWEKIFSADEKTQALAFRHLNRLQWSRMPRALQLEGLRNLRKFLLETRRASVFFIGLSLTQDWVPQEMASPDWDELLEMVLTLKRLAERKPPYFEKQNLAAKVALETIFCEPVLESLLRRYQPGTREGEGLKKLFVTLGNMMTPFLFHKIENEPLESESWKKSVDFLNALQANGQHVYEFWMEWPEKRNYLEKFLEIFLVSPLPGEVSDYFERHWNSFGPAGQAKVLAIVEKWKLSGFRGLLAGLLNRPETSQALQALQVLSEVGLDGDAVTIVESVKKFPPHGQGREKYWIQACRTLGHLADPGGLAGLMEWANKYKFLENKRDRVLEVRRAAIEALGSFRSNEVKTFLAGLKKEGEKELSVALDEAMRSVNGKLAQPK